jgi:protein TonB
VLASGPTGRIAWPAPIGASVSAGDDVPPRVESRRLLVSLFAALIAHAGLGALAAFVAPRMLLDPGSPTGGSGAGGGPIAIKQVFLESAPAGDAEAATTAEIWPQLHREPTAEIRPPDAAAAPVWPPSPAPAAEPRPEERERPSRAAREPLAVESAPPRSNPPPPSPTRSELPDDPSAAPSRSPTSPFAAATAPTSGAGSPDGAGAPIPGSGAPLGQDAVDRVAVPLDPVRPEYPRSERLRGREANVELSLVVDSEGRVRTVEVVRSAGERFDRASVEALRRIRFSPALRNGSPVPSRVGYTVRYRLGG